MATYERLDYGSPDGSVWGDSATVDKIGFFGTTPIVQRTGAMMAGISPGSLTTSLAGFGFYTATLAGCLVAQVEEIRATLVAYGIHKGSA